MNNHDDSNANNNNKDIITIKMITDNDNSQWDSPLYSELKACGTNSTLVFPLGIFISNNSILVSLNNF